MTYVDIPPRKCCQRCKHSHNLLEHVDRVYARLVCRRDPPVVVCGSKIGRGEDAIYAVFPNIDPDWCCGRYREKRP